MNNLNLAAIGNCQISALLDERGKVVWFCSPRLDGDPVFSALLSGQDEPELGFYDVIIDDFSASEQRYVRNTAVVETILHDNIGGSVRILDFAPRFTHYGRQFRPVMLARIIEPLSGRPRIKIRLRPGYQYGRAKCERTFGSHHIRYLGADQVIRLTTDASISHVLEENWFVPERSLTLLFGPDEPVPESVDRLGRQFLDETKRYWQDWVQGLSIPFEWQQAVIRAAITLKLCTFEDTGAVVAAITSSIPEAPHSQRNWDYRYCWLRDAYFVIQALNRLGATKTMEGFMRYIIDIASRADGQHLRPVYSISGPHTLDERIIDTLPGYRGMGPVRVGNQAYIQTQNDVYGAVVLAISQVFFDERLGQPGDRFLFERLEELGALAVQNHDQPDAGLWEYRGRSEVHTFSALMCWAACDRLLKISERLGLKERARYWGTQARQIGKAIDQHAWSKELNAYSGSFNSAQLDASLLLMHELGFKNVDDPRFQKTIAAVGRHLRQEKHLFRYTAPDDFGVPENAFNICTFWYIEAIAASGHEEEARDMFEYMLSCRNPMGLLSEDIDPATGELWGNIPQTYSMAGVINVATRLSTSWREAF